MNFVFFHQPFHIVEESPWPILFSQCVFFLLLSFVDFFYRGEFLFFFWSVFLQRGIFFLWSKDIIRESNLQGRHLYEVEKGFKWGIIWFIRSEVCFFGRFFWRFFHFRLAPSIELGRRWPPLIVRPIGPFSIPLLNTVILIRSGISLTWAHHALLEGWHREIKIGICFTIFLGFYFTLLQLFEYINRRFCFNDSIYGSLFFLATGFHGLHVIIGTIILMIVTFRVFINHFRISHHIGIEIRRWYWHFVDVVWLYLFCCIYWWGS